MIIYKATNKTNGLSYIGQTVQSLKNRKKKHFNGKKTYFSDALNEYGDDNFKWEVLEKCSSKEELNEMEFHYIKQYNTLKPNGYNLTLGGKGSLGWKPSKKTIEKMKKPKSKEHRKKISKARKGMKLKQEIIDNFKIIFSGEGNPMYGKKHSEETKMKISEKAKLRVGDKNPNYGNRGKKSKLFNKSNTDYIWKIICPDGKKIEVNRICKFCRDYFKETGIKLFESNFYNIRRGIIKQYKGFMLYD